MTPVPGARAAAVVGNRRTMIYQWPGCRYYDSIAVRNRVEFPALVQFARLTNSSMLHT